MKIEPVKVTICYSPVSTADLDLEVLVDSYRGFLMHFQDDSAVPAAFSSPGLWIADANPTVTTAPKFFCGDSLK